MPKVSSLSDVPLFGGLSAVDCARIEQRMAQREYPPQAVIIREGSAADAAYLVLSGLVAVRHKDPGSGVEFVLSELGPGQMFGEMALLTEKPRTASVVAVEATTCAVLERSVFEAILHEHPDVAVAFARVLAERLERANQQAGIDFVSLTRVKVDPRVLTLLPPSVVNDHKVLPIAFINNRLTLAMTNPNNIVALDDVRRVLKGVMIEPVAVAEDDFRRYVTTVYTPLVTKPDASGQSRAATRPSATSVPVVDLLQSDIIRELQLTTDLEESAETKQDLMSASEDAPIIRLANSILGLAIRQGASDIHIEPMEGDVTVRYRVDGVLQVVQRLPKKVQLGLISRVKILSRLDIAEKRLPQDGRISVTMEGKPIDFRVSTVPGKWGEKVCMRILDRTNTHLGLDALISHPPTLSLVREMIAVPHGIVYVTGPTGSGKTTTLYSALAEINDAGINISTAEDPIEYDLPGVTQIQANPAIGLTFASILRAFLRQDPDVMLVGETRDKETAHTAVEAALTGHLVFTTLHTNDCPSTVARLFDMGIQPFLLSSALLVILAQRLGRRICKDCKQPIDGKEEDLVPYGHVPQGQGPVTFYRGKGCPTCSFTGMKGRVAIYEVMPITEALRDMILKSASTAELREQAQRDGMKTLRQAGLIKVLEGTTTVEEVLRVTLS